MAEAHTLQAVQDAVDYIEKHLDERVSPSAVAAHVGFSEFHFHRVFVGVLGESISAYQRRRRLSRSARQLQTTKLSVARISQESGFESQEAFTRAFKTFFGCAPGQYRHRGGFFAMEKPKLTAEMIKHLQGGLTMEPKFITFSGQLVAGIGAGYNPDTTSQIPKLWKKFVAHCRQSGLSTIKSFGVCTAEHAKIAKHSGDSFVYMATIPISSVEATPPDMIPVELQAGNYAVFTHSGPIKDFPHTVKYIWSTWIPEHRELYREAPDFELYDQRFDPVSESGEVDVYVPVK